MKRIFSFDGKATGGARNGPVFCWKKSRMGQTWVKSDKDKFFEKKEIPKNGGVEPF